MLVSVKFKYPLFFYHFMKNNKHQQYSTLLADTTYLSGVVARFMHQQLTKSER